MAALTVVEDRDVFEDRVGEFNTRSSALPVQRLDLHPARERLDQGVAKTVAWRAL